MLSNLKNTLEYLLISQKYKWLSFFTYRTQSLMWLFYNAIAGAIAIIPISIIYNVSSGIAGWSYFQMLFLAASASIAINIVWYLVDANWIVWQMRNGGIDAYLTRPYGIITLAISQYSTISVMAGIVSGIFLLIFALVHMQLAPLLLLTYVVLMAFGTTAFALFVFMLIALSYKLLKSGSFMMKFGDFLDSATKYPLSIYGAVGRLVFSLFIPVGFAYYYPSHLLFGAFSVANFVLAVLASVLIAIASYKLFYIFMRSYTSGMG